MIFLAALAGAAMAPAGEPYVTAEPPKAVEPKGAIGTVLLAPLFREPFMCGEHAAGEGSVVGDELGTDCQVLGGVLDEKRQFGRLYRNEGRRNEDWFSWGANVLSPCDCVVAAARENAKVNEPGTKGRPPAGFLLLRRSDGVVILYAHVAQIAVAKGDRVKVGQQLAKVGNNGPSYAPHVHVGAYKGLEPLQIRWDQRVMAKYTKELTSGRPAK